MDGGGRSTVVSTIVHILPIVKVVRTDNIPPNALDIPVDGAVIDVFPSWVIILQTDLPTLVVLSVAYS